MRPIQFRGAALFFSLLTLGATQGVAKCGRIQYQVSVRVLDRATDTPVTDAQIVLFRPGYDEALRQVGTISSVGRTDHSGSFSGTFLFNTYSGWWFGDRCQAELERLQVLVIPPDRPAERFEFRGLQAASTDTEYLYRLEALTVRLSPRPDVQ